MIAVALAMAISLGCMTVAQAGACKGSISFGTPYERQIGGGWVQYVARIHNPTSKALSWTMHVWGLRAPVSAEATTLTGRLAAGANAEVTFATGHGFPVSDLQLKYDATRVNGFPTLSLVDCNP